MLFLTQTHSIHPTNKHNSNRHHRHSPHRMQTEAQIIITIIMSQTQTINLNRIQILFKIN